MSKIVVGAVSSFLCVGAMSLYPKGLRGVVDDSIAGFTKAGKVIAEDGRRMSEFASAVKFFVTGPSDLMERIGTQATKEQSQLLELRREKMRQRILCDVTREDVTGPNRQTGGEQLRCE